MHFKILGKIWVFFHVFNYQFTSTSVRVSRANIDTCNFVNCFILSYNISTIKLNSNAQALSPEPQTENDNDIEQDEFCIGDNPGVVLAEYLDEEELEKLILEEGNIFDNVLP